MSGRGNTYPDLFPVGCRVVVRAGPGEGSDREFNGRAGVIQGWNRCTDALVKFDKGKRNRSNPTWITCHNLERAGQ